MSFPNSPSRQLRQLSILPTTRVEAPLMDSFFRTRHNLRSLSMRNSQPSADDGKASSSLQNADQSAPNDQLLSYILRRAASVRHLDMSTAGPCSL